MNQNLTYRISYRLGEEDMELERKDDISLMSNCDLFPGAFNLARSKDSRVTDDICRACTFVDNDFTKGFDKPQGRLVVEFTNIRIGT